MSIFAKKKSMVWIVLGLAGARFFKGTDDWKKSVMRTQGWLHFRIFLTRGARTGRIILIWRAGQRGRFWMWAAEPGR